MSTSVRYVPVMIIPDDMLPDKRDLRAVYSGATGGDKKLSIVLESAESDARGLD